MKTKVVILLFLAFTLLLGAPTRARRPSGKNPRNAGAGGTGPSISVLNSQTGTALTPPINLPYPSTFTLRGDHFAPGVIVNVHLDSPTGPNLGIATPNKSGIFVANFRIPTTCSGKHTLVAVQTAAGNTLQATERVALAPQPK